MVLGQILKVGTVIFRHRKAIYSVLTAQDRYIDKAMKAGRYGLQARRGVRHGALGGSLLGTLIAPDSPGNDDAIQKPFQKRQQFTSRKPYKTRSGQTRRSRAWCDRQYRPDFHNRYS